MPWRIVAQMSLPSSLLAASAARTGCGVGAAVAGLLGPRRLLRTGLVAFMSGHKSKRAGGQVW